MNQLNTLAPKLIQQTSSQIYQTEQQRIKQILNQGGKQVDRIAPKIIKRAMGDMCKTPFRLLGQFGKKKLAQVERKVTRIFKKWYVFIEKGMTQENLFISNMEKKCLVPTANPC